MTDDRETGVRILQFASYVTDEKSPDKRMKCTGTYRIYNDKQLLGDLIEEFHERYAVWASSVEIAASSNTIRFINAAATAIDLFGAELDERRKRLRDVLNAQLPSYGVRGECAVALKDGSFRPIEYNERLPMLMNVRKAEKLRFFLLLHAELTTDKPEVFVSAI